ncbi:MAG: hypothetical protein BPH43C_41 [Phage 5P_1]|nr:MAG: hypothetical protein BPH43C_41 [Phage 5P_1]
MKVDTKQLQCIADVLHTEVVPDYFGGLLTPEQFTELSHLLDELRKAYQNQTIWRTYTEAICSVLNDLEHPTPASKYHQAKLEMTVFFEQLVLLSFDYREALIDLEEVEEQLRNAAGFERRRLEVKRDRLLFRINGMQVQARERLREIKMWHNIMQSLDDGTFDTTNKDTDQLIGMTIRYCRSLPAALQSRNDVGGALNVIGQAVTLLRECKRRGVLDDLGPDGQMALKLLGDGVLALPSSL